MLMSVLRVGEPSIAKLTILDQRRAFNREKNGSICIDLNLIGLDVVACADLASDLREPVLDVPLQSEGADCYGPINRNKSQVLCEQLAGLEIANNCSLTPEDD